MVRITSEMTCLALGMVLAYRQKNYKMKTWILKKNHCTVFHHKTKSSRQLRSFQRHKYSNWYSWWHSWVRKCKIFRIFLLKIFKICEYWCLKCQTFIPGKLIYVEFISRFSTKYFSVYFCYDSNLSSLLIIHLYSHEPLNLFSQSFSYKT